MEEAFFTGGQHNTPRYHINCCDTEQPENTTSGGTRTLDLLKSQSQVFFVLPHAISRTVESRVCPGIIARAWK